MKKDDKEIGVKFEDLPPKRQKLLMDTVDQLKPIDDAMAHKLMETMECTQEILRASLSSSELMLAFCLPQKFLRNLDDVHSVILDALCLDQTGNWYDVEVQQSDDDDHQKRIRYNISNMDTFLAENGTKYRDLKNAVGVILTKNNFLYRKGLVKEKKAVYEMAYCLTDSGAVSDMGTKAVYVNAEVQDGSPAADLMHFMVTGEGGENFPALRKRYDFFTKKNRGRKKMCEVIEKLIQDEHEELLKENDALKERAEEAEAATKKAEAEAARTRENMISSLVTSAYYYGQPILSAISYLVDQMGFSEEEAERTARKYWPVPLV